MEKLKIRILGIFVIFALFGMTGIASADPCPALNAWTNKVDGQVSIFQSVDPSNLATYVAQAINKNPVGGIPGLREVCIASSTSHTAQTALWDSWSATNKPGYVQFSDGGDPNNIPMDGNTHTVGTIKYTAPPQNIQYLVHINDLDECNKLYGPGSGNTCFARPNQNIPPVPELSTIILTASGLFGLVLVTKKHKKK